MLFRLCFDNKFHHFPYLGLFSFWKFFKNWKRESPSASLAAHRSYGCGIPGTFRLAVIPFFIRQNWTSFPFAWNQFNKQDRSKRWCSGRFSPTCHFVLWRNLWNSVLHALRKFIPPSLSWRNTEANMGRRLCIRHNEINNLKLRKRRLFQRKSPWFSSPLQLEKILWSN